MLVTVETDINSLRTSATELVAADIVEIKKSGGLLDTMLQEMSSHHGVGIAANQLGDPRAVIIVVDGKKPVAFVNPKIIDKNPQTTRESESCLSVPGRTVKVPRAKGITVRSMDVAGKTVTEKFRGTTAIRIQHECDHLNGVLITDYE